VPRSWDDEDVVVVVTGNPLGQDDLGTALSIRLEWLISKDVIKEALFAHLEPVMECSTLGRAARSMYSCGNIPQVILRPTSAGIAEPELMSHRGSCDICRCPIDVPRKRYRRPL